LSTLHNGRIYSVTMSIDSYQYAQILFVLREFPHDRIPFQRYPHSNKQDLYSRSFKDS